MAKRPEADEFSEFDGAGVLPSTVRPRGADSLTDADRLRLGYVTGVEDDPNSTPNPFHMHGSMATPEDNEDRLRRMLAAEARHERSLRQEGLDRYRSAPY